MRIGVGEPPNHLILDIFLHHVRGEQKCLVQLQKTKQEMGFSSRAAVPNLFGTSALVRI